MPHLFKHSRLLLFHGLMVAGLWVYLLVYTPRGFDTTDSGFYLLNYLGYQDFTLELSWFGGIFKYLYDGVGQSAENLRLVGVIITFVLTYVASWVVLRFVRPRFAPYEDILQQHATLTLAAAGALLYSTWLSTPSYNTLVLWGVLISLVGFLWWLESDTPRKRLQGAGVLGVGIALVGFGKPPSLLPLGLLFLAMLWATRMSLWRAFRPTSIIGTLVGMAGVGVLVVLQQPSLEIMLSKPQAMLARTSLLVPSGGTMLEQLALAPMLNVMMVLVVFVLYGLFALVFFLSGYLVARFTRQRGALPAQAFITWAIPLSAACAVLLITFQEGGLGMLGMAFYALALCAVGFVWLVMPSHRVVIRRYGKHVLVFSALFGAFALAATYGTDGQYTRAMTTSGYFWVLASVLVGVLLLPARHARTLLIMMSCAVLVFMVGRSLRPYRQAVPVWQMTERVALRDGAEGVWVDTALARYLADIQAKAYANGFIMGDTPVVDLTGESPGIVYALGGRTYGFAWLSGGYAGSFAATEFVLAQWDDRELARAWVFLSEEGGARDVAPSVLQAFGITFPEGYERVATFPFPHSTGTVRALYKPANQ